MEVNSLGLLGSTAGAGNPGAGESVVSLASNFDNFLMLLTTQLQNQDPLAPMDSTQFTQQLVMFSSVEQQISANKRLDQLIDIQRSNEVIGAVSFLGTKIEAFGGTAPLVNGAAEYSYTLASRAEAVTITISNEVGEIVRTLVGETEVGKHSLVWDGLSDQGLPMPDGAYTLRVAALDQEGNAIGATSAVFGEVTGVTSQEGLVALMMGSISVPLDQVASVTAKNGGGSQVTPAE